MGLGMIQRFKDWLRERRIRRLQARLASVDWRLRPAVWAVMREEISRRSEDQVRRMEEERGLT